MVLRAARFARWNLQASFDAWSGDPDDSDNMPNYGPKLHTSTAPGPDNVFPEVLRWSRPVECAQRFWRRMRICRSLAAICNKIQSEGQMPEQCCNNRSVPLFKDGDRSDPNDYRFITIGGIISKVWSLVMVRRITHWAVGNDILSESQAAFLPFHGCEEHVFTLHEAVRAQWREGRGMYAVFIDFKKAYDKVRTSGALFPLLRKMGVPDELVNVLESRSSARTSQLRVNGQDGGEVNMVDGVGQGDPLSCILFNLFIEPLSRRIASLPGLTGISIAGVVVKELKFADDIVILARTAAELQIALDAVQQWCVDWGMEIGIAKTNAIFFPPPNTKQPLPATLRPTLTIGSPAGPVIQWVEQYRYLGYWTWFDLRTRGPRDASKKLLSPGFLDEVDQRVGQSYRTTHEAHSLIRCAPPVLTLQLFRTKVSGAVNYLMSLTEPSDKVCSVLDKLSLHVGRQALRLGKHCPNSIVWAESRLPLAKGILARERFRFLLCQVYSPFNSIAKRVVMALSMEATGKNRWVRRTNASSARSWVHRSLDLMCKLQDAGVPTPTEGAYASEHHRYNDVKRLAGLYCRAVCLGEWHAGARKSMAAAIARQAAKDGDAPALAAAPALHMSGRPRPAPPVIHCADLDFGYQLPIDYATTGDAKTSTPISVRGPSCSGGLISLVTRQLPARHMYALGALRQGRAALFSYPLAGPGRQLDNMECDPSSEQPTPPDTEPAISKARRWGRMAYKPQPCPLCGTGTEDPFHVLTECAHPAVASARQEVLEALPSRILTICALALAAPSSNDMIDVEGLQLFCWVQAVLNNGVDWASVDGRFSLFRLLSVITWPQSVAGDFDGEMPLSAGLGAVFDRCCAKIHRLRPLANSWTAFSAASVIKIIDAYNGVICHCTAQSNCNSAIGTGSNTADVLRDGPCSSSSLGAEACNEVAYESWSASVDMDPDAWPWGQ